SATLFDRLDASLYYTRNIIRMNGISHGPMLQLFICLTKILEGLAVEKLHFAHCAHRRHQTRDVVDDLPPGQFSRAEGFLSTLAILDVCTSSVPFKDVARLIPQRIRANEEPSIGTVLETAHPRLSVDRGARAQTRLPLLDKFLAVVRMNRFCPPPALRVFRRHAHIIEPHLIDEITVAVRPSGPCRRGDCVDDGGKIALALLQSLLRPLAFGDIDDGADEFGKVARPAKDGMAHSMNVFDSSSWMKNAVVKFEVCFFSDCLLESLFDEGSVFGMNPHQEFFEVR